MTRYWLALGGLTLRAASISASQLTFRNMPRGRAEFVGLVRQAAEVRVHSYVPPLNPRGIYPGSWSRAPVWSVTRTAEQERLRELMRLRKVPSRIGPDYGVDSLLALFVRGKPQRGRLQHGRASLSLQIFWRIVDKVGGGG